MDHPLCTFGRRRTTADPLLFDADDKDTLDCLLGPADRSGSAFGGLTDLDFEGLDPLSSSDLNHWLQNSSLSQLTTALDTDHENSLSDGHLLPLNPENMPLQQTQMSHSVENDLDSANNAAMRLHANCSDVEMEGIQTVIVQQQSGSQTTQHIQLVAVPVTVSNGSSTPIHSPMKGGSTLILDSNTFSQLTGTTYIASPQKMHTVIAGQKTRSVLTPSQCSPVLVGHLQSGIATQRPIAVTVASPIKQSNVLQVEPQQTVTSVHSHHHRSYKGEDKVYPKPVFSYSCLIALALKNSKNGNLPVSEIYNFMCENFPYFKTAPDGWKNSVRHNLSLNKCFAKVDNPKLSSGAKKGCLWALNPAKVKKMEEEISKWGKKDPATLLNSMAYPENLEAIEKGQAGLPFRKDDSDEDENDPCPASPHTPLTPLSLKKELPSTPQKCIDEHMSDYAESPMQSFDMEQEYVSHANLWSLQGLTEGDIQMDHLLSNSTLTSSPIATICHTPSRSVHRLGVGMAQIIHNGYVSSPSRLQQVNSPSSIRINLFGITPTRTLSALN